jgi:hypothetical protein
LPDIFIGSAPLCRLTWVTPESWSVPDPDIVRRINPEPIQPINPDSVRPINPDLQIEKFEADVFVSSKSQKSGKSIFFVKRCFFD